MVSGEDFPLNQSNEFGVYGIMFYLDSRGPSAGKKKKVDTSPETISKVLLNNTYC
jgi:hypothetical protein